MVAVFDLAGGVVDADARIMGGGGAGKEEAGLVGAGGKVNIVVGVA